MMLAAVLLGEPLTRRMMLPCPLGSRFLSHDLCFHRRLIHWLTRGPLAVGTIGVSPVKLTNHFLKVNPPVTVTLDRRLIASVADRRALRLLAALHQSTGDGALSGPNRESSLSPVSWLLHPQGVVLCLAAYLLYNKSSRNRFQTDANPPG